MISGPRGVLRESFITVHSAILELEVKVEVGELRWLFSNGHQWLPLKVMTFFGTYPINEIIKK
ncbi:MAG: hypothetical protein EBT06_13220 [Gammaproteobacteria bacterium]|nr:hypothetical protein [Gammaproteobacteria bacterium]